MPTYEYECKECGHVHDRFFKVSECLNAVDCVQCGKKAHKILSITAIQCDSANDVSWLKSAEQVIKPQYEKPWDTRADYKDCLKRNNLVAAG